MDNNDYQGRSKRQQESNELIAAVCVIGLVLSAFIMLLSKIHL